LVAALVALTPFPMAALAAVPVGTLGVFAVRRAVRARGLITLDYDHLGGEEAARFSNMRPRAPTNTPPRSGRSGDDPSPASSARRTCLCRFAGRRVSGEAKPD
jgi:hypothetical protein